MLSPTWPLRMTFNFAFYRPWVWLGIGLLLMAILWHLGPVLTPFVVSGVLAYVLHPACMWLIQRRWPRWLAVPVVETLALAIIAAVLLLIVPILTREIPLIRDRLPDLAQRLNDWAAPWLARWGVRASLDVGSIKAFAVQHLNANWDELFATTLSSLKIGGSFVLTVVGNVVLVPVVLFYALMDWPRLLDGTKSLVPLRQRARVADFLGDCDHVLGQYLRGQLIVMLVLACFYTVALGVAGFELALPVGTFTGLAIFVPYLGFGLGLILAILAAALQFGSLYGFVAVAVIYGIGQVVESVFLTPRLVGERIGLHPVVVIFVLLAFGQLMGFIGVLVALPVSAVGAVIVGRLRRAYLASALFSR